MLTRREFLRKIVGAAVSVAGMMTGVGAALSGCDGGEETSNTTATVHPVRTTTTGVSTSTSTTVVTGPETGRDIKIGLVSAVSGPLALHGKADEWWVSLAMDSLADGVVCGDRRLHRFVVITRDNRSDPGFAAKAAADLILDARVDMVLCSGGTDLVVPVAAQAEKLLCPCLCSFVQWRPFVAVRGETVDRPPIWAYAHAVGLEDIVADLTAAWDRLDTNRKVGLLFADNVAGRAWADSATGLPPAAAAAGYECVPAGLYPASLGDFTSYVSEFKKNGCEIFCGTFAPRDFFDFWRQSLEQKFQPKIVTVGEGLIFPHALEALGRSARNMTAECLWQPDWPYQDSITGRTCYELAKDYMAKTGDQWTPAIAQYADFEWAVDVFRRVIDLNSRREIIGKVAATEMDSCLGPIDFTAPVDTSGRSRSRRPAANVYKAPVGVAQWVEGEAFGFEPRLVSAVGSPRLTATGGLQPMRYGP